jgi:hypothetical protein
MAADFSVAAAAAQPAQSAETARWDGFHQMRTAAEQAACGSARRWNRQEVPDAEWTIAGKGQAPSPQGVSAGLAD